MKNMRSDCELVSKKNNISFMWNSKFPINSLLIMRGYISLNETQKDHYLNTFFDAYWKDNLDLSSEKEFSKLLESLKVDSKIFFEEITQQSIKDDLKRLTSDAFKKEVFGAPTFIVNNKIFWGQDRLEYALEELN
jgi:2-hydroxychromene-2-carboxylate isomerase